MQSWRTALLEALSAMSDADLQQAMLEVQAEDCTGRLAEDGRIMRLATEIAPAMQTQPASAKGLVVKAVIVAAAYRFAGVSPDSKRLG